MKGKMMIREDGTKDWFINSLLIDQDRILLIMKVSFVLVSKELQRLKVVSIKETNGWLGFTTCVRVGMNP